MKKLMTGTSFIAMTAMERAAGRYMRAPDHLTGGDNGPPAGPPPASPPPAEAEPVGEEVNDPIEETSGGDRSPASAEDDSHGDGVVSDEEDDSSSKSVEERIGELTASEREAKRLVAERDRDLAYWRGRAEGTINEDGSPVNQPPEDRSIPGDDPDMPDPKDYQYGESDTAFIKDLARYEARIAYAEEREQEQVTTQLREVETKHADRVTQAKDRYADYDELVVKGADPDPATGEPKWFCSPLISLGIKTSDFGPDIAYHLASNKEESARIAQLSPLEQAKEFGRLEYRAEMEAKAAGRVGDGSASIKVTAAPEPVRRTRGAGGQFDTPDDTDDFKAFDAKVDAKMKAKGKSRR